MAERIDELEVGVSLNDRDLVEGIKEAEGKVDKFAAKVRKTNAAASVDLNLQKFKFSVKYVTGVLSDMAKKRVSPSLDLNMQKFKFSIKYAAGLIADIARRRPTVTIDADVKPLLSKMGMARAATGLFEKTIGRFRRGAERDTGLIGRAFSGLGRMISKKAGDAEQPLNKLISSILSIRVSMGFVSLTVRQFGVALAALGPVITGLTGSIIALTGAIGTGLMGAMAAVGAGAAGAALAFVGVKAAITPTLKGVKSAAAASKAYADAVDKYGQASGKAHDKLLQLNSTMAHVPASSRQAIRTWGTITSQFREMTRRSTEAATSGVLKQGVKTAGALMPQFARQTNKTVQTAGGGIQAGLKALRGPEISGQIDTIMSGFNRALPSLLKGFGQLGALLLRITSAASPQFVALAKSFAEWVTHINQANSDAGVLGQTIDRWMGRFNNIKSLLVATGSLLITVFGAGAKSGDNLIVSLTALITKWNTFLNTTKGHTELANFFATAEHTTRLFFAALSPVVSVVFQLTQAFAPLSHGLFIVIGAFGQLTAALASNPFGRFVLTAVGVSAAVALIGGKLITLYTPLMQARKAMLSFTGATQLMSKAFLLNPFVLVIAGLAALVIGLKYAYDHSRKFHEIVDKAFKAVKATAQSVLSWLSTAIPKAWNAVVAATRAVWPSVLVVIRSAWNGIKNVVQGGVETVKGIIDIFGGVIHGDFSRIWKGVREVFSGAWKILKGFMEGRIAIFSGIADAIGQGMHDALTKRWDGIVSAATGFINKVIGIINVPLKALGIDPIGKVGQAAPAGKGAGGASSRGSGSTKAKAQMAQGGAFERTGGFVGAPITLMGEEAPQHPEWVIPTNPAYRRRAVGLWAAAGQSIGAFMEGGQYVAQKFAKGGRYSFDELKALWSRVNPGLGNPKVMAAIAMAESGGIPSRNNADRPGDGGHHIAAGLWQILGLPFPGNVYDPETNARMAGAKLRSQGLKAWEVFTNGSYKQYLGGKGFIGKLGDIAGGALSAVANIIMPHLPHAPKGLGPFTDVLGAVAGKIKDKVKAKISEFNPLGGGGGNALGAPGGGGLGTFDGKPVANWIIPELNWARKHGWHGHITSGYRSPNQIVHSSMVAPQGHSNHNVTAYPGGAIDVGSPTDRANGSALWNVIKGYPGKRRLVWGGPAIGDWGHFSATGRKKGGVFGRGLARGGVYSRAGVTAFGKGGKNQRRGAHVKKKKPLTKPQVAAKKKDYQKQLDGIDDQLAKLRRQKQKLPAGKKGAAARDQINSQIASLMAKRTRIQRAKRDLPTGVDPSTIPVTGALVSDNPDVLAATQQTAIDVAATTPGLADDITAITARGTSAEAAIGVDTKRLAKIRKALKGKLRPDTRKRLLEEQDTITQRMPAAAADVTSLKTQRQELGIQRDFAGGRGLAGLDLLKAQAEGTTDLGDDVGVMNQQLALWQKLLVARTKRGDLSGMTEAQQNINTLSTNIAEANKQISDNYIVQGLDAADNAVSDAEATSSVFDDVGAIQAQIGATTGAIARAWQMHDPGQATDLWRRLNAENAALIEAQKKAEEAPLLANQALAAMTTNVQDDIAATQALLNVHQGRLASAQAMGDYVAVADEAGNVKNLTDQLVAAQHQAEEAPLLANQALAGLTDNINDDLAATQALLGLHEARLAQAQAIGDYAAITDEAGQVKSLRDQLNQQQGDVFAQTRLFSDARAELYKSFGSNYDPITPAGTAVGGTRVIVTNNFKYQPLDPHTWSRDTLFELQAAG